MVLIDWKLRLDIMCFILPLTNSSTFDSSQYSSVSVTSSLIMDPQLEPPSSRKLVP